MRVAVDAMGGDFAPREVVRGALNAAAQPGFSDHIILVGDESAIRAELQASQELIPPSISIVHAPEKIEMHEHAAQAMKRKRNSSLVVCAKLVKQREADATFSAGNTGATMAIALYDIGRIAGIDRPAIATIVPTLTGPSLLLDAGAMMDCSAQNLLQFAILGAVFAEKVMHKPNPTVGLLNVGSEPGKGNELTKAAFELLSASHLNFYGNVEGRDIFEHTTDVVVCDGFAGNVILKATEGLVEAFARLLRHDLETAGSGEGSATFQSAGQAMSKLLTRFDYAETGGAPLLGIDGVSFIGHGRSTAKAIENAIGATLAAASSGYVDAVREALA
jgi:phosphate acyltransferase